MPMDNIPTPAVVPDNVTPQQVADRGLEILAALTAADISLADPLTLLSAQLLGPLVCRAIGLDPRVGFDNILGLSELVDVRPLQGMIKGK